MSIVGPKLEDNLNFWKMEDDLKILENGRRPQFLGEMEDDLNCWAKWKTTSIFGKNGRRPQLLGKIEDDLNFLAKWKTT